MKKLVSLLLAVIMIAAATAAAIPATAEGTPFSDVEADRWSAGAIAYAAENGYMVGVADGLFDPEGALTRAQVAAVLWRVAGEPEPTDVCTFSDVRAGAWYSRPVAWAESAGIVLGVSETAFEPDGVITREQLAAMMYRYAEYAKLDAVPSADIMSFPDGASVSDYAKEPLRWAAGEGLVVGVGDGSLDPLGGATREQFAAIVERFDEAAIPTLESLYGPITEKTADWGEEMLEVILQRRINGESDGMTVWPEGVLIMGLAEAGRWDAIARYVDTWIELGDEPEPTDVGLFGYAVEALYEHTGDEKYAEQCRRILDSFPSWPTNEHGEIKYDDNLDSTDIYVDGTGMATPFLARYVGLFGDMPVSEITNDPSTFWYQQYVVNDMTLADVARLQVTNYMRYGLVPRMMLVNHGYRGRGAGCGEPGWGRGTGWFMFAVGPTVRYCGTPEFNEQCEKFINKTFTYILSDGMFSWSLSEPDGPSDMSATGMILWGTLQAKEAGICGDITAGMLRRTARACLEDVDAENGIVYGSTGGSGGFGSYSENYNENNEWGQGALILFYAAMLKYLG